MLDIGCSHSNSVSLLIAMVSTARQLPGQRWSRMDRGGGAARGNGHVLFDIERRVRRGRRDRDVDKGACQVKECDALTARLDTYITERDIVDAGFRQAADVALLGGARCNQILNGNVVNMWCG